MRYKIGIFGSSAGDLVKSTVEKAKNLGQVLSMYDVIVITGACSGLPYEVALNAVRCGVTVWGYSPADNLKGQKLFAPTDDLSIYKKLFYVPKTFPFLANPYVCKKYRNVISTANCDAGIIISGRWGTMNEFTNLFDMGKVIGVLTKTGGIADELKTLNRKIHKTSRAKIIFGSSPKKLVDKVMDELKKRK